MYRFDSFDSQNNSDISYKLLEGKMKKLICLLLSLTLIFVVCACNNGDMDDSSPGISSDDEDKSSSSESPSSESKTSNSTSDSSESSSDSDMSSSVASDSSEVMGSANTPKQPIQYTLSDIPNDGMGWGQGKNLNEENQPVDAITFQEKYGKYNAYFIAPETQQKTSYLTFDSGYENGVTEKILDALLENEVNAVFFITMDYVKAEPELIQRMIADGHTIGNHTWKHKRMPDITIEDATAEITQLHDLMIEEFDYEMNLFRFPEGYYSERTLALVNNLGYSSLFWSYAYQDWDVNNQMGYDAAYEKVTDNMHDGAIYLLHSVSPDNAAILSDFIKHAKSEGFEFGII